MNAIRSTLAALVLSFVSGLGAAQSVFEPGPVFSGINGSGFGISVAGSGDVDQDGFPDALVGEPYLGGGTVWVFSGKDGSGLNAFSGDSAGDLLGTWVSGAGDIDQDGAADLVAGAPGDDDFGASSGSARVYSGATGAVLYTFHGDSADDRLGSVVSGAGDVDNDGFPDVAAGSVYDHDVGTVRVWSGFDGSLLQLHVGAALNDGFGFRVDITSDFDGDGHADVAASAPWNDDIGTSSGHVRVFSGKTGSTLATLHGMPNQWNFGDSLAVAGDVDDDGLDDLIVGITFFDTVNVLSGKLDGTVLLTLVGNPPEPAWTTDKFGIAVGGVGDVDGDGHADVAVGSVEDDDGGSSAGTTYVFSGADGRLIDLLAGQVQDAWFGCSVGALGDVDLDGAPDLIVGAKVAPGASGVGTASVFLAPGSSTTPYGVGCAGAAGFVPKLASPPGLWISGGTAQVSVTEGLGGSTALLLFGLAPGSTSVAGCTLLVSPLLPLPVPLPLQGVGPGTGSVTVAGTLPMAGAPGVITMQAIVADPTTPAGFSATNGLTIEIH